MNMVQNAQIGNLPVSAESDQIEVIRRGGVLKVSSKEVAQRFGKLHKNVLRDIRNLECSNDFFRLNFEPFKINSLDGDSVSHVEMTRDGFTFLAMGFTGKSAAAWKERFIYTFNAMEDQLRRAPQIDLHDPVQLLQLLTEHASQRVVAEQRAITAEKKAEAMAEDVAALDRLAKADGSLCITDAAKALQMRPKALFGWLRENGWIYKRPGAAHDLGYQSKTASGLLEHKVTTVLRADGSEKVTEQVRVTPKGLEKLAKLIFPAAKLIGGAPAAATELDT